jgi:hypothetical protein
MILKYYILDSIMSSAGDGKLLQGLKREAGRCLRIVIIEEFPSNQNEEKVK